MAGKNAKRVLRISKETQPYRTELTPVSFLRRSASSRRVGSTGFTRCRSKPASRACRMSSLCP